MGRLEDRLRRLEAEIKPDEPKDAGYMTLVGLVVKDMERWRAKQAGEEPPPYTRAEVEERRRQDLKTLAGDNVGLRDNPGWQSEEAQRLLDIWEEDARRRLEKAEGVISM